MPVSRLGRAKSTGLFVSALVALWLVAGCASSSQEEEEKRQEKGATQLVTGEFVGKASAKNAYVALFSKEGSTPNEAEVIAYVCNGPEGLAEWFTGTTTNESLELDSNSGNAHLSATLADDGAAGTVKLPDGQTVSFEALSSAGDSPAGLYELTLDTEGNLYGSSWSDKYMNLAPAERNGFLGYVGTVRLPEGGEEIPYDFFEDELEGEEHNQHAHRTNTAGVFRTIILSDGSGKGSRQKSTGTTSSGIIEPVCVP